MKTRKRRNNYAHVKARAARELRATIASLPELQPLVKSSTHKIHVPTPVNQEINALVVSAIRDGLQTPINFTWTSNGIEVGEPDIIPTALQKYASPQKNKRERRETKIINTSPTYVWHAIAYMQQTPPRVWLKQPLLPSGDDRVAMLANTTVSKRYLEKYDNKEARRWCTEWLVPRLKRVFISSLDAAKADKALKMRFIIGHPCQARKWPIKEPPTWSTNATDNYVNWSRLNETTVRRDWNVYDVNAFYELESNTVVVPNAFLGFYVEGATSANMATLGTSIGHEMAHAFDHDGVFYGTDGDLLEHPLSEPLSGSARGDETAADRVGIKLALEIVQKEGLDEVQFREAYAAHWPKYKRKRGDVHAAGTTRTRAAFRNK